MILSQQHIQPSSLMYNINKTPTWKSQWIGRIYATDALLVTFRKPIDTKAIASWNV